MLAAAGVVAGAVSAIALVLTTTGLPTGLFQRIGLTAADIWIAASGLAIAADDSEWNRLGGGATGEAVVDGVTGHRHFLPTR